MLQIRNMESNRCIRLVENELNKLGLHHNNIELGKVELKGNIPDKYLKMLDVSLKENGLELMLSKENVIISKIKDAIRQLIYLLDDLPKQNFPEYISKKINYDYAYLSNLFSGTQGITIEKYIIEQKIERVKELLVYEGLSLSDIAFKLQYSSVAHLSNQFKKVTGLTPTFFRHIRKTECHKS